MRVIVYPPSYRTNCSRLNYLCYVFVFGFSEIDREGVIEPDVDDPQDMGELEDIEVKLCTYIKSKFNPYLSWKLSP